MSTHLDPDQLADLQEDLLQPAAATAAAAHLRGCESCRRNAAALDEVRRVLASAPDAAPMPADVAARLDAALAAELDTISTAAPTARAAGAPGDDEQPAAVTLLPSPATRRWWANHRVLQSAAAVVLVFAGGAVVYPVLQGGAQDSMPAATADREAGGAAGAESKPQAAGAGSDVRASGNNYSAQTLAREVTRLVTAQEDGAKRAHGDAAQAPAAARLANPAPLADCVATISPGSDAADRVLVDVARFNGRNATLIVLELPGRPDQLGAWIVEPGCRRGDSRILHYETVPRP